MKIRRFIAGVALLVLTWSMTDQIAQAETVTQTQPSGYAASDVTAETLTDAEMRHLVAGQGCFGFGSENCCKEMAFLMLLLGESKAYIAHPYFRVAFLAGSIHRILFC